MFRAVFLYGNEVGEEYEETFPSYSAAVQYSEEQYLPCAIYSENGVLISLQLEDERITYH